MSNIVIYIIIYIYIHTHIYIPPVENTFARFEKQRAKDTLPFFQTSASPELAEKRSPACF